MLEQRRLRYLRLAVLALALAALGMMLLRIGRVQAPGPAAPTEEPSVESPLPPITTGPLTVHDTPPPLELDTPPAIGVLTLTPAGLTTPADQWAARILEHALPLLEQPLLSLDAFVWWQSSSLQGEISLSDGAVRLGEETLNLDALSAISILVPDPASPTRLLEQASITWQGSALLLNTTSSDPAVPGAQWLLSGGTPTLALRALVLEAEHRDLVLTAAFTEMVGPEAQLVLISADTPGTQPQLPSTPQPGQQATPTASRTPTPERTPTPTRVPEAFMGRVLAEKIDPVIDAAPLFDRNAVARYTNTHPWIGPLTWADTGSQINGRPLAVTQASELTFYTLEAGDPAGTVSRFLNVVYDGTVTRLPEDQLIFQEQRMEEVLFWLVRRAVERGGYLVVAYDDFGTKQAITVVAFRTSGAGD